MGSPNSIEGILKGAKETLANADKFTKSVVGNGTDYFAPKPLAKASYSLPHAARKAERAIPGGNEGMSSELNEAQRARDEAKKAINQ